MTKETQFKTDFEMLVLTRKIGQQVVLPQQGITVDVVDIGKTRVRLGITAPTYIFIERREAAERVSGAGNDGEMGRWGERETQKAADRVLGGGTVSPTGSDSPSQRNPPAANGSKHPAVEAPPPADFEKRLAQWIARRTGDRIRELSVERHDDRIVIRGSARSYYVRQLAQAAVNELLKLCDRLSLASVEYDIDVAQVYWRSAGHMHGLARFRVLDDS
jgi:carbon storage regulator CsrA